MKSMYSIIVFSLLIVINISKCSGLNVTNQIEFAIKQYTILATTIPLTGQFISTGDPLSTTWKTTDLGAWTVGFYSGTLWMLYKFTNDIKWKELAEANQIGLFPRIFDTGDHDVGFIFMNSYGLGLELTGNKNYENMIIQAATSFLGRFFKLAGVTRSWNNYDDSQEVKVIVDNMMNLELLFKAHEFTGENYFRKVAISHAEKTILDHFREDGGTYHVVAYDENTGNVKRKYSAQGYSINSTWSRGQAWAIYGFITTYKYTNDIKFLQIAEKAANYFINQLPQDYIPYWDFNAPHTSYQPRDTSAGAISACAFLQLYELTASIRYFLLAENILESLSSVFYRADGLPQYNIPSILVNGTVFFNNNDFDTSITYGDYYFLKALDIYQKYSNIIVNK